MDDKCGIDPDQLTSAPGADSAPGRDPRGNWTGNPSRDGGEPSLRPGAEDAGVGSAS